MKLPERLRDGRLFVRCGAAVGKSTLSSIHIQKQLSAAESKLRNSNMFRICVRDDCPICRAMGLPALVDHKAMAEAIEVSKRIRDECIDDLKRNIKQSNKQMAQFSIDKDKL